MNNSEVCGVVVLYDPDDDVLNKILTYASFLDTLYVINNSDEVSFSLSKLPCNTIVLSSGKNLGIATALDMALEEALADGYTWMLTMDQDGSFETSQLKYLLECQHKTVMSETLLISPLHVEKNAVASHHCQFNEVDFVMTSGNLVCVQNAKNIGGYDRKLFIDEVDHEFCFRGNAAGYKVFELLSAYVNHQLGVHFLHGSKKIRLYPPERLYYMARNYLYLKKKYQEDNSDFFTTRTLFLKKFFYQHLRYSPQRLHCLQMLFKGWYDYKRNHYGPIYGTK